MKIFYKPFGIISGVIGAKVGSKVFHSVWRSVDTLEPPDPTAGDAPLVKVVLAASLEAAMMAAVGAVIDRSSASAFHYLTGAWPGKTQQTKTLKERD